MSESKSELKRMCVMEPIKAADRLHELEQQLSEAQALISMQAEALKEVDTMVNNQGLSHKIIQEAISASAESVAAWEEAKLKPLRQQVALLYKMAIEMDECLQRKLHSTVSRWTDELAQYQTTAEAYEREVVAKALAEVRHFAWQHGDAATCRMLDEKYGLNPREQFNKLRAANNGGAK